MIFIAALCQKCEGSARRVTERANPGRCEVERRRRAEPAGADQKHARVEQLLLADFADLGNQDVA